DTPTASWPTQTADIRSARCCRSPIGAPNWPSESAKRSTRVRPDSHRQLLQRPDTTRLGAMAPLLQVHHQLLAAQMGSLPDAGQLIAHFHELVERFARREDLGRSRTMLVRPACRIEVKPATRRRHQLA